VSYCAFIVIKCRPKTEWWCCKYTCIYISSIPVQSLQET